MRKNPENPTNMFAKIVDLVSLHFFPPNLLTEDFIISNVIGSFLVVSNWQRRWHPSNANCTKGLPGGESNPIM